MRYIVLFFVTSLVFSFSGMGVAAADSSASSLSSVLRGIDIVAVVNSRAITVKDVEDRLRLVGIMTGMKYDKNLKPQVLQTMIQEYMQIDLGKVYGVEISEEEIAQTKDRIERSRGFEKGYVAKRMKELGIPKEIYDDHIKAQIIWEAFIHDRFRDQIDVSEAEISSELELREKLKDQTYYRVAEIVLPITEEFSAANVEAQGNMILEMLKGGKSFAVIASQFSKSPTALYGGDLGFIAYSQLNPVLKGMVSQLAPGMVSKPVRVGDAYVLYYIISRVEGNPLYKNVGNVYSYATISMPIVNALSGVSLSNASDADIKLAQAKFEAIIKDIKDEKTLKKFKNTFKGSEKGFSIKSYTDLTSDKINPEVLSIIDKLSIGEISPTIIASGSFNAIVLLDMTRSNDPDIERKLISVKIKNRKINNIMNREIRKLYKNSFVDIKKVNF